MNSDEVFIKLMFLGIVAGLGLAAAGASWWIAQVRARSASVSHSESSAAEPV